MDLMPREMRIDPYPMYAMMRASSPVLYYPDQEIWLVFGYDDVRTVLSDHKAFSSQFGDASLGARSEGEPLLNHRSLITSDPPHHTQLRNLISRAFTPRAVASLEPRIVAVTHALLDKAASSGEMDLIKDLAEPLPVVVIAEMLGIPAEDRHHFKQWSDHVVASSTDFVTGAAPSPERAAALQEMQAYFKKVITARRAEPREDLISGLLAAEIDGQRLSEEDLLSFCWLLLVAGNETTTNLLGNGVRMLLEHPAELERLRANPALLVSAIEEVLRYRSPVQAMFRVAAREVELGGQTIAKGQRVVAFLGSANRDETRFPDADRFDIGREPNSHVDFGHGIHFCLGAPLARLEAQVALSIVLERLPDMEAAWVDELQPVEGLVVHGVASLPIRFRPGMRRGPEDR